MSNHLNHTEMIDAYLTGRLSPEESSRLEKMLEQDPSLKEEFKLQQDLVRSIQENRRMELKSRLNAIDVGTGSSLPSAAGIKMIAGAALIALLGTGSWFAYQQLQSNSASETPVALQEEVIETAPIADNAISEPVDKATEEEIPTEQELNRKTTESPTEENSSTVDNRTITVNKPAEIKESKPEEPTIADNAIAEESSKTETNVADNSHKLSVNSEAVTKAEVIKPEVITQFDDPDAHDSVPAADVPEDKLNKAYDFEHNNIEVSTITDKRYPFHYMFFDNQLHIYGDFSKVPYEVLEVNTGNNTRYFLFHDGHYYELNPNQRKVTRLQELTNEKTIQELEITRTSKLKR